MFKAQFKNSAIHFISSSRNRVSTILIPALFLEFVACAEAEDDTQFEEPRVVDIVVNVAKHIVTPSGTATRR